MIVLAVECTTLTASVALCEDRKLLGIYTQNIGNTHSETLLPMLDELLVRRGMNISNVDLFAVSAGPGSFTGIRIGVSMIKGLAFDKKKPCVGVSSLNAFPYSFGAGEAIICPVINARRGNVYNAFFRIEKGGNVVRMCDDRLISCTTLSDEINALKEGNLPLFICGDGIELMKKTCLPNFVLPTPPLLINANAYSVALAAVEEYSNGNTKKFTDTELLPTYLRPTQAERELKGIPE